MKLLGVDYGEKKVGLAIGDTDSKVATPYKILKNYNWSDLISQISEVIENEKVKRVVVGLPINHQADGDTPQMKRNNQFIEELGRGLSIPVEVQDESFTTQYAQKLGVNGQRDDDVAAMIILQSYIDKS